MRSHLTSSICKASVTVGLSLLSQLSASAQTGSMRGFADIHNHQFANMAFGGYVVAGEASGPAWSALSVQECLKGHSANHAFDILGGALAGNTFLGLPAAEIYHNDGYPAFSGWPAFFEVSHQKTHQDFLYRAVQGGMRLMVMFAVESPILCKAVKNGGGKTDGRNCDDEMTSIKNQLNAAYAMQDYIDLQAGGPGAGWYRVVTSPQQARNVIQAGKLAVVLGVETSHLFQCASEPCFWQDQFDELWNMGVRHFFPLHHDKNAFGGPSDFQASIQNGIPLLGVNPYTFPTYNCGYNFGKCDSLGLTATGKSFIQTLMSRGALIDVDHMSDRSFADTLDVVEKIGYPVVASHSAFNAVSQRSQDHEGQLRIDELNRIRHIGGMLGLISSPGDILTVGTYKRTAGPTLEHNCGRSSETFAQMYYYARDNAPDVAVGIGTDINGPLRQAGPRFGNQACDGGQSGRPRNTTRLPSSFLARGSNVTLSRSVVGNRTFDFNVDGLAHEGLLPDMLADLEVLGMSPSDVEPLFHSAEGYVQMWEKADRLKAEASVLVTGAVASGDTMTAGQVLPKGRSLNSANGQYSLILQNDGNLVLYSGGSLALWASNTMGIAGTVATLQSDGNFVLYEPGGVAAWASGTPNGGTRLVVQNDGNVVIYRSNNTVTWSTNTFMPTGPVARGSSMRPGEVLFPGQQLSSGNGRYTLVFQGDGNLLMLKDGRTLLWKTATSNKGAGVTIMQGDGNLVVYAPANKPLWASNTLSSNSLLALQDDGNLVIYRPNGTPAWASNTVQK